MRIPQGLRAAVGANKATFPWDLAYASYSGTSFSVSTQETQPTSLFFKPDGSKMFILGNTNDTVYEYSLSSAWDISTASYVQDFSVAARETNPTGLFFKGDGTKMYTLGATADKVNEYSLSSAWDISTASYVQDFSVGSTPTDIFFKPDGTQMFAVATIGDKVIEYSLSSAWDISTASYVQDFSVAAQDTSPLGLFFKTDGSKMFFPGSTNDKVYEYSLSSAWDISTASYVQDFSVAAQSGLPMALSFKGDGTKMFIVDRSSATVYSYNVG